MVIKQYGLTWNSHRSYVCDGFVNLQQNEEFVDMTLAADGYLVNVHKNVFALASPYIKAMLRSTPTQHPVIFLSNVSCDILNYIITYVYTGEVFVDADKMTSFMKAAKELCLKGLGDLKAPKNDTIENRRNNKDTASQTNSVVQNVIISTPEITTEANPNKEINTTVEQIELSINSNVNNVETDQHSVLDQISLLDLTNETTGNQDIIANTNNCGSELYITADGYQYRLDLTNECNNTGSVLKAKQTSTDICQYVNEEYNSMETDVTAPVPVFTSIIEGVTSTETLKPEAFTPQYTTSNRGSLQLILNRYMYYCHHQSHGGRKRRWRCIDYRRNHCPAFIDTDCEVMTIRKFLHSHSFHDDKIMKKLKGNNVFTTLNTVIQKLNSEKKEKVHER